MTKEELNVAFTKIFEQNPTDFFVSPGRLEIIGNHTDHNNGLALVASASIYIYAAVKNNASNLITLHSEGYGKTVVEIKQYEQDEKLFSTTEALLRGIVSEFLKKGYKVSGVDIYCNSEIPSGSGISSSAAFEMLICTILNEQFNNGKIDKMSLVHISQYAENHYFGKPCGLLDQIGVAFGGLSFVDFKDFNNPIVLNTQYNLDLEILLTNPGGSHAGLDKYYASIPDDMHAVASYFKKSSLREISYCDFKTNLLILKNNLTKQQLNRAIHFFEECIRVENAFNAVKNNDANAFIKSINESGNSSSNMLCNSYVDGRFDNSPEKALQIARKASPNSGHRVHGGGFMGTIISFSRKEDSQKIVSSMENEFGVNSVIKTSISPIGSSKL